MLSHLTIYILVFVAMMKTKVCHKASFSLPFFQFNISIWTDKCTIFETIQTWDKGSDWTLGKANTYHAICLCEKLDQHVKLFVKFNLQEIYIFVFDSNNSSYNKKKAFNYLIYSTKYIRNAKVALTNKQKYFSFISVHIYYLSTGLNIKNRFLVAVTKASLSLLAMVSLRAYLNYCYLGLLELRRVFFMYKRPSSHSKKK